MMDCAVGPAVPLVGEYVNQLQLLGFEMLNEVDVVAVTLTIFEAMLLNVNEVGLSVRPLLPLPPPPPLLELPLTDTTTGTAMEVFAALVEEKVTFAVFRPFARPVGSMVTVNDPGVVVAVPLTVTHACDDVTESGTVNWSLAVTVMVEALQPVPPDAYVQTMSPEVPFTLATKTGLEYTVRVRGIDCEALDEAIVNVPLNVPAESPPTAAHTWTVAGPVTVDAGKNCPLGVTVKLPVNAMSTF